MPAAYTDRTSKQHPVPQNIMSVEFKLIGELTIKQFAYVGVGAVMAYLSYASGIAFLWKWLFVFLFAGLGLGMAFVPLQDRGLDIWIRSFIKALLNPAIMVWGKVPSYPRFLTTFDEVSLLPKEENTRGLVYKDKEDLIDLLNNLQEAERDPLEEKRYAFMRSLDFTGEGVSDSELPLPEKEETPTLADEPALEEEKQQQIELPKEQKQPENTSETPGPISVPMPIKPPKDLSSKEATYTSHEREFEKITEPNIVNGVVYDKSNKLLEGAVLMIEDKEGEAVRALKTNALGRFKITTPLPNGEYFIKVRKDGENFDRVKVVVDGNVLPPLRIIASNA